MSGAQCWALNDGAKDMRAADLCIGGLLTLAGALIAYEGHALGLGQLREPGPGFILFWTGLVLAGLAATIMVTAPFAKRAQIAGVPLREVRWAKLAILIATLGAYAAALDPIGFIPATVLMLLVLFRTIDPLPWLSAVIGAVATTAVVYVVFGLGLGAQFPMGLLGNG